MTEAEGRAPRPRRAPNLASLQRSALHYLELWNASEAQLERVLLRRIERRARERGEEAGPYRPLVAEVIAACRHSGLLDDRRFAETRSATLQRRGKSRRAIGAALAQKGVARELIEQALPAGEESERTAARETARRKRLGPWRQPPDPDRRDRDLAALLRAGFTYGVAREALDGSSEEP